MEYIQSIYDKKTWLPISLIEQSFEEKWERSLCFFIKLRMIHKKPIFYNYSLRKIGELTNYSPASVKRHLDILKLNGLVVVDDNNLRLVGTSKLHKEYQRFLVPVKFTDCKRNQLTCLRYTLIKRNIKKQVDGYNKALNIIKSQNNYFSIDKKQLKGYHRALKFVKKQYDLNPEDVAKAIRPIFNLSNVKFGNLINRGKSTGLNFQKELNDLGFIKSSHRRRFLFKTNRKELFYMQEYLGLYTHPKFQIADNGFLYERLANKIEIFENFSSTL